MNRIRKRSLSMKETDPERLELARQAFMYEYSATIVLDQSPTEEEKRLHPSVRSPPRRQQLPLPPSPLGLSNYDAFDNEDGFFDDDGNGGDSLIYSDFNVLEPSEPVIDDHDALSAFDNVPFWGQLLPPQDEIAVEMMMEKERQKEISFVRFEI